MNNFKLKIYFLYILKIYLMNKYYNISKDWKNVNEMDANDFKNFICYSNDFLKKMNLLYFVKIYILNKNI